MRWMCALIVLAGCGPDAKQEIKLRWEQTFASEVAPPGIGAERRVLVALTGTSGEVSTHEESTGLKIEGPHATLPTARAPVGSGSIAFIVSTVGRVIGLAFGDGSERVNAPSTPLGVASPIAVAPDGSLRVGSTSGRLLGLRADGTEMFDVMLGDAIDSAPAVSADGTAYVALFSGRLVGVDASGQTVFDQPTATSASAVSVSDRWVACGDTSGLEVFDFSGASVFTHPRQVRVTGTVITERGVLASGEDGIVDLVNEGGLVWSFTAPNPINANPIALPNGNFVVVDTAGIAYLLDGGSGEQLSTYDLGGEPKNQIAIGEQLFVYVSVGTKVIGLDVITEEE